MNASQQPYKSGTEPSGYTDENQDFEQDTVPRLNLNLNIGNITGIPSALGMTDGGQTTKYQFQNSGMQDNIEGPQNSGSIQYVDQSPQTVGNQPEVSHVG